MALIRAFRAIRPRTEYAGRVISLPYDVMNREEAKRMAEDNPYSFLSYLQSRDRYAGGNRPVCGGSV